MSLKASFSAVTINCHVAFLNPFSPVSPFRHALHQQKGGLRQIHSCCILTLLAWTLRPVRPVRPVPMRHIWLRLVRLESLGYTGFRPDTCNEATLPPMHPDLTLNTIAHQDSPLPSAP